MVNVLLVLRASCDDDGRLQGGLSSSRSLRVEANLESTEGTRIEMTDPYSLVNLVGFLIIGGAKVGITVDVAARVVGPLARSSTWVVECSHGRRRKATDQGS